MQLDGYAINQTLTQTDKPRVEYEQRCPVVCGILDGFDHHWEVATDVVHQEEEDADDSRPDLQGDDLNDHGEQNGEPGLGWEKSRVMFL